jgi:AcrR family transcriptional regulator
MTEKPPAPAGGSRRGPAREERRQQRREQFLDVTAELIEAEGLAAVTMERVAALAAVSKPMLYRHFGDRSQLLVALIERCWRDIDRSVQARLTTARTFDQQLEALVTGYFDEIAVQGRVLQLMVTSGSQEPTVEAARHQRYRAAEVEWSQFYQQKASLPPVTADVTAAIMRSALQGAAAYWIDHPEVGAEECIATCLAIMRAGLGRLVRRHRQGARTLPAAPPEAFRPPP